MATPKEYTGTILRMAGNIAASLVKKERMDEWIVERSVNLAEQIFDEVMKRAKAREERNNAHEDR